METDPAPQDSGASLQVTKMIWPPCQSDNTISDSEGSFCYSHYDKNLGQCDCGEHDTPTFNAMESCCGCQLAK